MTANGMRRSGERGLVEVAAVFGTRCAASAWAAVPP